MLPFFSVLIALCALTGGVLGFSSVRTEQEQATLNSQKVVKNAEDLAKNAAPASAPANAPANSSGNLPTNAPASAPAKVPDNAVSGTPTPNTNPANTNPVVAIDPIRGVPLRSILPTI